MMDSVRTPLLSMDVLLAHHGWVRALAKALVRDENGADDLVQMTWVRALQNPPDRHETVRAWLGTIMRNLARDRYKADGRRAAREARAAPRGGLPAPDVLVARAEAHRRLIEHVTHLPEPYREVVLLRFFEGLPPREIAERLGIPAATVRTRLHRALATLRATLDCERGGADIWLGAVLPLPAAAVGKGAAGAGSGGASGALLGGLVVTAKQKILAAVILALLFTGSGAWLALSGDPPPPAGPEAESPTGTAAEDRPRDRRPSRSAAGASDPAATEEPASQTQQEPAAQAPPAAAGRQGLTFRLLGRVAPRQVPDGFTELLPGEDPVIEDPATAVGPGADGPRLLPYWSRWAPVPAKGNVTFRGRVVDASGGGIEGAEVYRVRLDAAGQRASPSSYQWVEEIAVTDGSGRFEAREQPAGSFLVAADWNAVMRRPRGLDLTGALPASADDGGRVEGLEIRLPLDLAQLASVTGIVRDEKGDPLANVEVTGPLQRVYTGAKGEFALRGLLPQSIRLSFRATGYARLGLDVHLAPGETDAIEVDLDLAEKGSLVLEGRVLDEDDVPVEGAPVFFSAGLKGSRWARTDGAGVFRFEKLPDAYGRIPVDLMVSPHPDRDMFLPLGRPVKVTVPSPDLVLRVRRTTWLHVFLRDAISGEPLPLHAIDAEVHEVADGTERWASYHSLSHYEPTGEARFSVPKGRFRLTIRAKDHAGVKIEVDVPDVGGAKEVIVAMDRE